MAFGNQLSTLAPHLPTVRTIQGYKQLQADFTKINQRLLSVFHRAPQTKVTSSYVRLVETINPPIEPKVKIAIVGGTGSGKSTAVNAILGVKKLIPSSGMRACTAVVTTVEYNDDPTAKPYTAKVHFISSHEWKQELQILVADLENTSERDWNDEEHPAAIAAAKIRAVYPTLDIKSLTSSKIADLVNRKSIRQYLDIKPLFESESPEGLYDKLKPFVDSKDKGSTSMELWPLIQEVCIRVRSAVLETGIVLVDLPGVADSNAARSTIAQKYLRECNAVWIMAPIIRAVDDKIARNLFNQQFKVQLVRDGMYRRMAFIASKTDDLKVEEIRPVLMQDPDWEAKFDQINQKLDQADADLLVWTERKKAISKAIPEVKNIIKKQTRLKTAAEKRKLRLEKSQTIRISGSDSRSGAKRKTSALEFGHSKRTKTADATDYLPDRAYVVVDDDDDDDDVGARDLKAEGAGTDLLPTIEHIKNDIDSFEKQIQAKTKEGSELLEEFESIKELIKNFPSVQKDIYAEEWTLCLQGRNERIAKDIQRDFIDGFEDIMNDMAQDEGRCDNGIELSDEEREDISLPVFTISSDGYRSMKGLAKDSLVTSMFTDIESTGVPQLMEYAHALGATHTQAISKKYSTIEKRVLTSIGIWTQAGKLGSMDADKQREVEALQLAKVNEFFIGIHSLTDGMLKRIGQHVKNSITASLNQAIQSASSKALPISGAWGAPRTAVKPGLHWATYRSTCRHNGILQKKNATINMPAQLSAPFSASIDRDWTVIFNEKIPAIFIKAIADHAKLVTTFGDNFIRLLVARGGAAWETTFSLQLSQFAQTFSDHVHHIQDTVQDTQRNANRSPGEVVQEAMAKTFSKCALENGPKMFERMRDHMGVGVLKATEQNKENMFFKLHKDIKGAMKAMSDKIQEDTKEALHQSHNSFKEDCERMVQEGAAGFDELPIDVQDEIRDILSSAEEILGELPTSIDVNDTEDKRIDGAGSTKEEAVSDDELDVKDMNMDITDDEDDSSDDDYDEYYK